jgi:cytochrome d ubiquinol oxidase subunit II
VRARWFDFPQTFALMLLPAATGVAWLWVWRAAGRLHTTPGPDWQPFAGAAAIFALAFAGLAYSLFPYVVLDRLTIWQAAAHESALRFVLWGTVFVLPFVIGNALLSYRIFGGKVREALYH